MKRIPLLLVMLPLSAFADTMPDAPALKELQDLKTGEGVFKASGPAKPIVLKTDKEAADYFAADELAKLTKQLNFKNQMVLIFAWQGSGQDKLSYSIAESYPEQIAFSYAPGRTKDLRTHVRIFALRSNVTWNAK